MSTLKFRSITAYTWEDFAYQLISRYIGMALTNYNCYICHNMRCHTQIIYYDRSVWIKERHEVEIRDLE